MMISRFPKVRLSKTTLTFQLKTPQKQGSSPTNQKLDGRTSGGGCAENAAQNGEIQETYDRLGSARIARTDR
jgi:uncharacterized protein YjbK